MSMSVCNQVVTYCISCSLLPVPVLDHLQYAKTAVKLLRLASKMTLQQLCIYIYICMWQSQVEIKHYSVAYFDRVTAFEVL